MIVFKDLNERLDKAKTVDDLLEIASCGYIDEYYQLDPEKKASERHAFLEGIISKIHSETETTDDLLEMVFYAYINEYYKLAPERRTSERYAFLKNIINRTHKLRTMNHILASKRKPSEEERPDTYYDMYRCF